MEHKLWGLGLRVLPWVGLAFLIWQVRQRLEGLTIYSWEKSLWKDIRLLPKGEFLIQFWFLWIGIPALSLWVDSLKWILLMHPSLTLRATMKMAWRQCPQVAYSMLGSMAVPGRLSEFAGRFRFYPVEQHPRVMASTLMASSTQWVWVLALPAIWILGFSIFSSDLISGAASSKTLLRGLPVELGQGLSHSKWGLALLAMAALAVAVWWRIYRRLQGQGWSTRTFLQTYFWSLIRYGLLVLQWVLWLEMAGLAIGPWLLLGVVCAMLALQWFMPLGLFMDLGFKGALSFWIWGGVLVNPVDALWIPLMIWITNLAVPALLGGLWWWTIGHKSKVL
ncbi:MAG: hypothetical protein FJ351_06780 [Sphingomonadales bacterium]|nr:hypothetical protein [Sphingomonadales bacterium]